MEKKAKQIILIGSLSALYLTVFLIYILRPLDLILEEFSRFLALFGLLSLFVSSIMAAFTREIFQVLGKPFKKVHHIIGLTALGLITFHPIFIVISYSDASLFLPNFGSLSSFVTYAGAPSLYLILLATLAGYFQRKIPKFWRYIHGLNYVALIFGVIHGIKIGGYFSSSSALKIIYILMLVLTTVAFGFKRYRNYKKKKEKDRSV
ncbi:MAG: hypothetical protein H7647_01570 [Candidatus Heimdallarchaeota archaeon]|nr:hypothetical protein [Candidatus Heimdallarchaeota archaeon]MCK4253118.1 hypothetical protein [Candidatus Heimdallarchaeota archaeon]